MVTDGFSSVLDNVNKVGFLLKDSAALNNRVDSLTFQVRCLETEKKKACEERDKSVAQVCNLFF